jgi:glutathione S-transferase
MSLVLHEFAGTRSTRDRWVLQEIGAPFEAVKVDLSKGEHRKPEFLAINPCGKLPALVDDGVVITESAAIALYLAEKYPRSALLPSSPEERAQLYRWLFFTVTEIEQPLWRMTKHRALYPEALRIPADIELAKRDLAPMLAVLEKHMQGREYVAGSAVSVADFMLAYTLDWANELKLLAENPTLVAYMERMYQRPNAVPRLAEVRKARAG